MKPASCYYTKEKAREVLAKNTARIKWDEPDKIAICDIAGRDHITLVQLICVAYNLKPNE
jgi:hypothetical protein